MVFVEMSCLVNLEIFIPSLPCRGSNTCLEQNQHLDHHRHHRHYNNHTKQQLPHIKMCIQRTRYYKCGPGVNHTVTYRHYCSSPPPHNLDSNLSACFDHECEADLDWVNETYPDGELCPDCTGEREQPRTRPIAIVSSKDDGIDDPPEASTEYRKFAVERYADRLCKLLWAWINVYDVSMSPVPSRWDLDVATIRAHSPAWIKDDVAIAVSETICPVHPEHGMYQWLQNFSRNPAAVDLGMGYSYDHWKNCSCIAIVEPRLVNPAKWLRLRMAQQLLRAQCHHRRGDQRYLAALCGVQNNALRVYERNTVRMREKTRQTARAAHFYLPIFEYDRGAVEDRKQKLATFAEALHATYHRDPITNTELSDQEKSELGKRSVITDFACLFLATDTGLTLQRATEILTVIMAEAVMFRPFLELDFQHGAPQNTATENLYMGFKNSTEWVTPWGDLTLEKMWAILHRKTNSRWNRFVDRDDWRVNLIKNNILYADEDDQSKLKEAAKEDNGASLMCQICWETYEEHETPVKTPSRIKKCHEAKRACWYNTSCYIKAMRAKHHPELSRLPPRCTTCNTQIEDAVPGEDVKELSEDPKSSGRFVIY